MSIFQLIWPFIFLSPLLIQSEAQKSLRNGNAQKMVEQNGAKFSEGKCAFYCFFVPMNREKLINLTYYENLSCSDIVYGFAEVGNLDLKLPTERDLEPHSAYGNFKRITSLQTMDTKPRVLLGMKMAKDVNYMELENAELAANVSQMMVFHARQYSFSGIFLKFEPSVLLTHGFEQFIQILSDEIKNDEQQSKLRKLSLVLSISSNWVRYVYRRMPKFDAHFDAFYLWADEIDSAEQLPIPPKAVPVDPLHPSPRVPHKDSLSENAERLAGTGISRKKIIIGFSAWARSYLLQNATDTMVPPAVVDFGYTGDETKREDGKLAFQEICSITNNAFLDYDNISETISMKDEEGLWISFNPPDHQSFIQKLDWVSNHEFGGVGIYNLQADDPYGNCSQNMVLPLHQSVANRFKCRRGTKRGNAENEDCTRVCILNLDESAQFDFDQLDPGWCSHIVLGKSIVNPMMALVPNQGMRRALTMYNDWERERKPFLILSFTGTAEQWQAATASRPAKYTLVDHIRRLLDEHNADGVDLNCANGGPEGRDAFHFHEFLSDLRRMLGKTKQIMVSLHPNIFIEDKNYDFPAMAKSVDYFIAIGYRFHHHQSTTTGHHSPLFPASMLNQPKMTIQGMVETMVARQAPKEKIIVALSAQAMSQHFADDLHNHRSWEKRRIGQPASRIYPRNRTHGPGIVSYSNVCELMKSDKTQTYFMSVLDVPYLINEDDEFIAFDNERSIQIKSVWISLQGLAGIALHGLEMDNIGGECPEGEPFPLLRTIAESQICLNCNISKNEAESTTGIPSVGEEKADGSSEAVSFKRWGAGDDVDEENGSIEEEDDPNWRAEALPSDSTTMDPSGKSSGNCQAPKDGQKKFEIFCGIPIEAIGKNLSIENLPFDRCNSMILSGWAKLAVDGVEMDETEAEMLKKIVEIGKENGTEIWAEMSCEMGHQDWGKMIGDSAKREQFASTLASLIKEKQLNGLLLDCDAQMRGSMRTSFSQFLNEINDEFEKGSESDGQICISKLALKIQLSRTDINEVYEPEQLNKLLRFILLPSGFAVFITKAKILNPLYTKGINSQNEDMINTQNGTFFNWMNEQLNSDKIVMELPTFGIKQIRENGTAEPTIVPRNEICEFMKQSDVRQTIRYDAVAAFWKTQGEWLSAENGQTMAYKTQFAIQHQMGGIMLNSLDMDDPENLCNHEEPFPMLEMVHKSKCEKKSTVTTNARVERDMLSNMMMSRGRR